MRIEGGLVHVVFVLHISSVSDLDSHGSAIDFALLDPDPDPHRDPNPAPRERKLTRIN
jgi:hypothetical protein